MSTVTEHYGEGVSLDNTSIGDLINQKRCCVGINYNNPFAKWFRFVGTNIIFCEYCAKTCFDNSNIEEIAPTKDSKWYFCQTVYTNKNIKHNIHNRCTHYGGFRVNVNIINRENTAFVPAVKFGNGTQITAASRDGKHIALIPNYCFYEVVISGDPNHSDYSNDVCFKLEECNIMDGRVIHITNSLGESNILYNIVKSQLIINSRESGNNNTRLMFICPSAQEKEQELAPSHTKKSNIMTIKLGVYRKVVDNSHIYRSAKGSGDVADCYQGSKGGATLEANGSSSFVSTTKATEDIELLKYVNIYVQLVNNEYNRILLSHAVQVQKDIEQHTLSNISKLEEKLKLEKFKLINSQTIIMDHLVHD